MAVVVFDPAARVKGYALGNMALDMDNIQHVSHLTILVAFAEPCNTD